MAVPTDNDVKQLLDQFVCVRAVQMFGVDLDRFQFDYQMTWAVFLLNGDGNIYGRYGTRSGTGNKSMQDISLAGFKKALRATLALHRRYEKDPEATTSEIAGKQPQDRQVWKNAEDIPKLKERKLAKQFQRGRSEHASCIHCHMVPNHEIKSLHDRRKPIPDRKLWPFPPPRAVGLEMDKEEIATVTRALPESAAAAAGLEKGDAITRFAGQTVLSTADLQWALHNTDDTAAIPVVILRDGAEREHTLKLTPGWRQTLPDWRFTNLNVMNWMVGFNGEAVPAGERARQRREGGALAFRIRRVDKRLLRGADLRKGDLIVEVDGKRAPLDLGGFVKYIAKHKRPGGSIKVVRRRGGKDKAVKVRVH